MLVAFVHELRELNLYFLSPVYELAGVPPCHDLEAPERLGFDASWTVKLQLNPFGCGLVLSMPFNQSKEVSKEEAGQVL